MTPKPPVGIRKKKCANRACRVSFVPSSPFISHCSPDCAVIIALDRMAKKKAKEVKSERAADKKKLEKFKSRSDWMREAQTAFNSYVRARDSGLKCASCEDPLTQNKRGGMIDCSHYRSVGSAPHMRFHLHNCAAACIKCNRWLGGNVAELRKGLIARIGREKIEAVEADNSVRKFDIEYLKRVKRIFTKKAKRKLKG
jgi:hypothetical protein